MQKQRHWLPRSFTISPPGQGFVRPAQLRAEAGERRRRWRLLADMEAGYRAKDPERIVAHYAADIVVCSLAPPLRTHRGEESNIGGGRKAGGDVAYAHGLSRMGSPGQFSLWFRFTVGLDKKEGAWQISHLHASVPFYMDDTMKAALDLVPLRRRVPPGAATNRSHRIRSVLQIPASQ